eukprot:UN02019
MLMNIDMCYICFLFVTFVSYAFNQKSSTLSSSPTSTPTCILSTRKQSLANYDKCFSWF